MIETKTRFRPYLLQRLERPQGRINPFAFGGGYKNGGLSEDAVKLVQDIWAYDYMGSAEFEFGALPKSLAFIVDHKKDYVSGEVSIRSMYKTYDKDRTIIKTKAPVYYICLTEQKESLLEWLSIAAKGKVFTKEYVGLDRAICQPESQTVGWHDIENHFMFFTDREMFESAQNLLLNTQQ